jgi:hypothetical protein
MKLRLTILFFIQSSLLSSQDTVHYTGNTLSNIDYHHGQLSPAIGVHNIQTFRANRADKENNWTYNHAPMLAYWNQAFYLEYLSNPVGEHVPPGQTLLQVSKDGYHWKPPVVIFPPYPLADGTVKSGRTDSAKNSFAVMHQRIGFYISASKKLFALAYYGIVLGAKDDPNDGNGIGRVIREIKTDGSFGPICFLRYNHAFNEKNTRYPFYKNTKDKELVKAGDEILHSPLLMQQMVEEADRDDALIPLKKDLKAFNYYHLPNGNVVGLWKFALTSISTDEGKTWLYNPLRAPGFVNANAKIWGQKTSDNRYVTVYNPSEFRWPLALSVSENGLAYKNLLLVNGEITSLRYGGAYKSYGPQYVRGIPETEGLPPDGNIWVTYSMNKEDVWVSKIPVPVKETEINPVNEDFSILKKETALDSWNLYSPSWCRTDIVNHALVLTDSDPFDYAKAERIFPNSAKVEISFAVTAQQMANGDLEIELTDKKGTPCCRLFFDSTGVVGTKQGYRNKSLGRYLPEEKIAFRIILDCKTRFYTVQINNGKPSNNLCFAPVDSVNRIVFRTGSVRRFPDADTPTDQSYDLPFADNKAKEATFSIHFLKIKTL